MVFDAERSFSTANCHQNSHQIGPPGHPPTSSPAGAGTGFVTGDLESKTLEASEGAPGVLRAGTTRHGPGRPRRTGDLVLGKRLPVIPHDALPHLALGRTRRW